LIISWKKEISIFSGKDKNLLVAKDFYYPGILSAKMSLKTFSKMILPLSAIMFMPSVKATSLDYALGSIGRTIYMMIANVDFRFALLFFLVFVLFYGVYSAALTRSRAFEGKKGIPNKPGTIVAVALSLMTTLGFVFYTNYNQDKFGQRFLEALGTFGAIAISFLASGMAYFAFRTANKDSNWGKVFFIIGVGLLTFGTLAGADTYQSLGLAFTVLGVVGMLIMGSTAD